MGTYFISQLKEDPSSLLLPRFMQAPSHIHLGAARIVLRYLQGTMNYGFKFNRDIDEKLIGFCDSDWGSCLHDIKSTSGYAFTWFSWASKK